MSSEANQRTSYVCKISAEQADQLRALLAAGNWELDSAPHARWRARKEKTSCVAYESGKLVIQGKGTAELVQFVLEPEVLKEARFGYEDLLAKEDAPEMFAPHAGIDESGKGDFFGPLVCAAAYVDEPLAHKLLDAGVQDSKRIKSDKRIQAMAGLIRETIGGRFAVVTIGPPAYNRLYAKIGNVNRLLAWAHARALEDLLEKVPDCPRAVSDQFAVSKSTVARALMKMGREIKLEQRTKAESDVAVAAASILARAEFVRRIDRLGEDVGIPLPKGASQAVIDAGGEVIRQHGIDRLGAVAKLHFRTTDRARAAAGLPPAMHLPETGEPRS